MKNTTTQDSAARPRQSERDNRRAAALRANLVRRKRPSSADEPASGDESPRGDDNPGGAA
jgi:hypothetical protein